MNYVLRRGASLDNLDTQLLELLTTPKLANLFKFFAWKDFDAIAGAAIRSFEQQMMAVLQLSVEDLNACIAQPQHVVGLCIWLEKLLRLSDGAPTH